MKKLIIVAACMALAACGAGSNLPEANPKAVAAPAALIVVNQLFTAYVGGQVFQIAGEGNGYGAARLDAARKALAMVPTAQYVQLDDGRNPIRTCPVVDGAITECLLP